MSHRGARNYYPPRQQNARGRGGRSYGSRPPMGCAHFTWDGNCQFGQSCRNQHRLRNVGSFPRAHTDTIYCLAAGPLPNQPGAFQIFTGGRDQCVKRWSITPTSGQGGPSPVKPASHIPEGLLPSDALAGPVARAQAGSQPDGLVFYDIKWENTTPFESSVTSVLLAADCLFCGLTSGKIRGFLSATGHAFELAAHHREVHTMAVIDQILVTGDFGGTLCFWQPARDQEGRPTFNLASTIQLANGIKSMKEVVVSTAEGPVKTLWVGCVERVYVIHLQSLSIASEIRLPQPPGAKTNSEVCMELLPFGNFVLAGGVSGTVYQLYNTGQGIERQESCDEVMCMDGLMSEMGPMLVVGNRDGMMSWLSLPSCQESISLQAHSKNVRGVRVVDPSAFPGTPPAPPFIISVSEDQAIHLWTLSNSNRRRPGSRQAPRGGRGSSGRRY